jgi:hypothetical protein
VHEILREQRKQNILNKMSNLTQEERKGLKELKKLGVMKWEDLDDVDKDDDKKLIDHDSGLTTNRAKTRVIGDGEDGEKDYLDKGTDKDHHVNDISNDDDDDD